MNKTPLLEFVYNRKKTATKNRETAVELRITFERKQKYMTTGIRLLPKHWHRGSVVNRIDAREMNETLEKLMAEVRQVILEMMSESVTEQEISDILNSCDKEKVEGVLLDISNTYLTNGQLIALNR